MMESNGKWIVFCKDIAHMEEVERLCSEWFEEINPNQDIVKISSANEREENTKAIEFLRSKKNKNMIIVLTVNMLNEAFHDEELSGIIMARSTHSNILYRQQLGRGLNWGRDKTKPPYVFDLVNNIRYFQEFRQEVQEIIESGIKRGETVYSPDVLEQFKVYSEYIDFIEEFRQVERNIDTYLKGETTIAGTLRICQILYDKGANFEKLPLSRTINGKTTYIQLSDMEVEGIEDIISDNGDVKIGYMIDRLRKAYKYYDIPQELRIPVFTSKEAAVTMGDVPGFEDWWQGRIKSITQRATEIYEFRKLMKGRWNSGISITDEERLQAEAIPRTARQIFI